MDHFFLWNSRRHVIWWISGLLRLWSTTLPCIRYLQAAIHALVAPQPDLLNSAPAEIRLFCVPHVFVVSLFLITLSPLIAGALLSRLPKIIFPTKYCRLCVMRRSVPFCHPVTAQTRITLAFIHLFFNHIACSCLICYLLWHFQHNCLISSSFLPNIFGLDYIYLLMEKFNLQEIQSNSVISSTCHVSSCSTLWYFSLFLSGLWNSSPLSCMLLISYSTLYSTWKMSLCWRVPYYILYNQHVLLCLHDQFAL